MEFELTIRGSAEELPSFLDLLRKNGGEPNKISPLKISESDFTAVEPWRYALQLTLWESLSPKAQELMFHIGMDCNYRFETDSHELFDEEWICNSDGAGHLLIYTTDDGEELDYCPVKVPCEQPECHRQANGSRSLSECGIPYQSLGARLANIRRHLGDPKYSGLTDPIIKYRKHNWSEYDAPDIPLHTYSLQANWPAFIARQWQIKNADINKQPLSLNQIGPDDVLGT